MKKIVASFAICIAVYYFEKISATDMEVLTRDINQLHQLAQEYSTTEDQNRLEIIPTQLENLWGNICSNPTIPQLISDELIGASREPNKKELPAVNDLISFLRTTGIEISEARYIDALSTMPKAMYQGLMADAVLFIEDPEKDAILRDNIPTCYFSNERFKDKLIHEIYDMSERSSLFRKLLVSLIMKTKFPHDRNVTKIVSPFWQPNRLVFCESDMPQAVGDFIYFPYDFTGMYLHSFFNSQYTVKEIKEGVYAFSENYASMVFHEMGHSWIGDFFILAEQCGIDNTISLFSKIITGIDFDEDALDMFFFRLHMAPETIQEKYIKHHNELHDTKFTTLDEIQSHIMEKVKSSEGVAEILFGCSTEIIQIMGLALIKCGDKNILFINSLSDFALSIELIRQIRNDHKAYAINPENESFRYMLPEKLFLSHAINLKFYGDMFKVYRSSIQQYVLGLMYGNNLLSKLKYEWSLGRDIRRKCHRRKYLFLIFQNSITQS